MFKCQQHNLNILLRLSKIIKKKKKLSFYNFMGIIYVKINILQYSEKLYNLKKQILPFRLSAGGTGTPGDSRGDGCEGGTSLVGNTSSPSHTPPGSLQLL